MRTPLGSSALKDEYKKLKLMVKATRRSYEEHIIRESKNNPKLIYGYLNHQRKQKDKIRSLSNINGDLFVDKNIITNLLIDQFQESFSIDCGKQLP
ncbi:hypothetical protein BpHYR1_036341, partial [Brachionus plicatilis]